MHCTPLAQDLQGRAPAPGRAQWPRPERTRAAPTGLTPRLHTAGVGGAGAPAWGVKGGAGRDMPVSSPGAPRRIGHCHSTASPRHTRAPPHAHHAHPRANPEHAGPEHARSALLLTPLMAYPQVPNRDGCGCKPPGSHCWPLYFSWRDGSASRGSPAGSRRPAQPLGPCAERSALWAG